MPRNSIADRLKKLPLLWIKCPKCSEILYAQEVIETNKCFHCKHVFPVPVSKVEEVRSFIRENNPTLEKLSDFIFNIREKVDPSQESLFLKTVYKVVQDHLEWLQVQKIQKRKEN